MQNDEKQNRIVATNTILIFTSKDRYKKPLETSEAI